MNTFKVLFVSILSVMLADSALGGDQLTPEALPAGQNMYVIEREIPGAGKMSAEELKAICQKSSQEVMEGVKLCTLLSTGPITAVFLHQRFLE